MERKDDQNLWDILGKSASPEVSPFFARDVLRRVREEDARPSFFASFGWRRLIPVSALAAMLALIGFFAFDRAHKPTAISSEDDLIAKIDVQDYEVVADLDELLEADENTLWDDNSSL